MLVLRRRASSCSAALHCTLLRHGHLLSAGVITFFQFCQVGSNDALGRDDVLPGLVTTLEAALMTYQIRARRCGKSFKHMVLLEAGVQGWYVTALLY